MITKRQIKRWLDLAEKGDAEAQYELGLCYGAGDGIQQDFCKAVEWYEKAARQGHAYAQTELGYMYEAGEGVGQNYAMAMRLYRLAARQGDEKAQFNIGVLYDYGRGVKKSEALAVRWYRRAALNGNAFAMCNLGTSLNQGRGVRKNIDEAVKWYRKAARLGDSVAQYNLAMTYYDGIAVRKSTRLAMHWLKKSAEGGHAKAVRRLKRLKLGRRKYLAALKGDAANGDIDAAWALADAYADGFVTRENGDRFAVRKNRALAERLYRRVAEEKERDVILSLAIVQKDLCDELRLERKAWRMGIVGAANNMAMTYSMMGRARMCFRWLMRGYAIAPEYCAYHLALCHLVGYGTTRNPQKARQLFGLVIRRKWECRTCLEYAARFLKMIDRGEFPMPPRRGMSIGSVRPTMV
jgi:TPR repeat protein